MPVALLGHSKRRERFCNGLYLGPQKSNQHNPMPCTEHSHIACEFPVRANLCHAHGLVPALPFRPRYLHTPSYHLSALLMGCMKSFVQGLNARRPQARDVNQFFNRIHFEHHDSPITAVFLGQDSNRPMGIYQLEAFQIFSEIL